MNAPAWSAIPARHAAVRQVPALHLPAHLASPPRVDGVLLGVLVIIATWALLVGLLAVSWLSGGRV